MRAISAALLTLELLSFPAIAEDLVIPEGGFVVSDDPSQLPPAVAEKRATLIATAKSGNIEALRPIFDAQPVPVTVSFGGPDDPIAHLRGESANGEGHDILAILLDVLEAPFAAMDGGDGDPVYVWPYLAAYDDLSDLSPADRVEGIRVAGAENFQLMQEFGVWIYWRAYIGLDGQLQAFVAGD